jgi:di/tricarboxylate transporter
MSNTAILWACLIAIIVMIAAYNFKRINMGFTAMAFAFVIGCVMQGTKASVVYSYWPDNLAFFLLSCSLFFGYASENGTMEVFGKKLLYKFRNNTKMVPWVMFFITALLSFLGAGTASQILIAPVSYAIGMQLGLSPLMTVCAVSLGYTVGTYNPWTGMGVQIIGLVENNGLSTEIATKTAIANYCTTVAKQLVTMLLCYIYYSWKAKRNSDGRYQNTIEMDKPDDFNSVQKKTLTMILISFVLLVVPNIINTWIGIKNPFFKNFLKVCQPHSIFVIFAFFACCMNLADTKKVIQKLPMNTILLVVGVSFLMAIAKKAGMVDVIKAMVGDNVPKWLIGPFLCMVAGILSIFSSTWSVVLPLMYPLVPPIAAATGVNPVGLYSAILFGANATGFSPFSTAGSMFVGLAPEKLRDSMVVPMVGLAIAILILTMIMALLGFFNIFNFIVS